MTGGDDGSLINKRIRNAFREAFSEHYVLRTIDFAFDSYGFRADLDHDPGLPGQRRTLVEQYYASIDFTSETDIARLLRVYSDVLVELPYDNKKEKLLKMLKQDGYELVDGQLEFTRVLPALVEITQVVRSRGLPEMERLVARLTRATAAADPALMVGTAKDLVESVCKTVLEDAGIAHANMPLPRLVRKAAGVLSLLPEDIPDQAKGKDTIRKVLNSLTQIVNGISELRNLYGTGHGRHGRVSRAVTTRHARLVVGAASTVAIFLLDTQSERSASDDVTHRTTTER